MAPNEAFLQLVLRSRARIAIAPLQDVLGLGSEARMNTPGTNEGNWIWRLREGQLREEHAERLRELSRVAGRLPQPERETTLVGEEVAP